VARRGAAAARPPCAAGREPAEGPGHRTVGGPAAWALPAATRRVRGLRARQPARGQGPVSRRAGRAAAPGGVPRPHPPRRGRPRERDRTAGAAGGGREPPLRVAWLGPASESAPDPRAQPAPRPHLAARGWRQRRLGGAGRLRPGPRLADSRDRRDPRPALPRVLPGGGHAGPGRAPRASRARPRLLPPVARVVPPAEAPRRSGRGTPGVAPRTAGAHWRRSRLACAHSIVASRPLVN